MKKFITSALPLAIVFSLFSFTFTGTTFEGKMLYDISVEGANLPPEAKAMFAGSEIKVYVKGMKSRTEMTMGFQNTITFTDRAANTSVTLIEVMGSKYMIKNDNSKDTDKTQVATVKELSETKTIAGYKCKKAEVTFKDKSGAQQVTNIYYTEEIANQMGTNKKSYQFKNIKGMPLEYEILAENGMKMKMTAKSVTKEAVADTQFTIPTGYKETTEEEMQKEIMQKMGQH